MKKIKGQNLSKAAVFAGAAALMALTPKIHAQSAGDALVDKLEQKGILTAAEAAQLREENKQDFNGSFTNSFDKAFDKITGTPDWVTGYKFSGDFRGRFEDFSGDSSSFEDRMRLRYRLRAGVVASMADGLEAGFRFGSGDPVGGFGTQTGNPLSNNTSFQDDFTKKFLYVDAAYGKWTAINSDGWLLSTTIGKMDNPFQFTPMVFDSDLTPEGVVAQGGYTINDKQAIVLIGGVFILDEEKVSTRDPLMYGGQLIWNAKWTPKLATSLGIGAFDIVNKIMLTTGNVPFVNQGNSRSAAGVLIYNYNPIIADASVTYTLAGFPLYNGAFPIKFAAEYMNNPAASDRNTGFWVGATFGKSGKKRTWDISYRYEYLEGDAWYDQLVDDDNGAYYLHQPVGSPAGSAFSSSSYGWFGGTNIKGHLIKLNYSITDSLTFTVTCFINDLINDTLTTHNVSGSVNEPKDHALHFMADMMWKF